MIGSATSGDRYLVLTDDAVICARYRALKRLMDEAADLLGYFSFSRQVPLRRGLS
jgi:hypothetical protein